MQSKYKNTSIIFGIASVLLLAILALVVINLANLSRLEIQTYGDIPDFEFVERDGAAFGKVQMAGKIHIVNFFFTSCKGPCPYMNSRVAELYNRYVTTDRVRFVSISVDPARDSLNVLQRYAEEYGVTDSRWLFLRGELQEVHRLSEEGFKLAGDLPTLHSTKLILVDSLGKIRGYYNSFDEESLTLLTTHVKKLLQEEYGV